MSKHTLEKLGKISILHEAARSGSREVRLKIASNSGTPSEVLSELWEADKYNVPLILKVTKNPNTPSETLEKLWFNGVNFYYFDKVASNILNHSNITLAIIKDAYQSDRWCHKLITSTQAPIELLERYFERFCLDNPGYEDWAMNLIQNPNLPEEILRKLFKGEYSRYTVCKIAKHANVPPDILSQLATNPRAEIRKVVAQHTNTPSDVLDILKKDKSKGVRSAALDSSEILPKAEGSTFGQILKLALEAGSNSEATIDKLLEA